MLRPHHCDSKATLHPDVPYLNHIQLNFFLALPWQQNRYGLRNELFLSEAKLWKLFLNEYMNGQSSVLRAERDTAVLFLEKLAADAESKNSRHLREPFYGKVMSSLYNRLLG